MTTRVLRKLQGDLGLARHANRILNQHVVDIDTRDPNVQADDVDTSAFAFTVRLPHTIRNVVFVELVYIIAPSMKLSDQDGYVIFCCPELFGNSSLYIPFSYGFWHLNAHLAFPLILERGVYCKTLLNTPLNSVKQLTIRMARHDGTVIRNTDIESGMIRPYTALTLNLYSIPRIEVLNLLRLPSDPHHFLRARYRMILVDSKNDPNFMNDDVYKFRVPLPCRLTRPKSVRLLACGFPPLGKSRDINNSLSHVEVRLPQLNAVWQVQNSYWASSEDVVWLQTDPLHVHHLNIQDLVTAEFLHVECSSVQVTDEGPPAVFSKIPLTKTYTAGKKQCTLILHFTLENGLDDSHP